MAATTLLIREAPDGACVIADVGPPPAILVMAMLLVLFLVTAIWSAISGLTTLFQNAFNKPAQAMPERYDRQTADQHFRVLPEPLEEHFAVLDDEDDGELHQRCFICGGRLMVGDHDHDS